MMPPPSTNEVRLAALLHPAQPVHRRGARELGRRSLTEDLLERHRVEQWTARPTLGVIQLDVHSPLDARLLLQSCPGLPAPMRQLLDVAARQAPFAEG